MSSENVAVPACKPVRSLRRRLSVGGFVVLLLLIPFVRLAWIASHTETGWETISQQWRDAAVGLVAGEHRPISNREPVEQAAFWLAETDRIIAEDPRNPELAMGAALLLSSPGMGYEIHHVSFTGSSIPDFDREAIDRAVNDFQNRCRPKSLKLAAKATELEPNEPRWWRLRAMLSAGETYRDRQHAARLPDRLTALQQYRKHDPDNALYDYLATYEYWKDADEFRGSDIPVVDQAKYNRGLEFFARGQRKRFFSTGGGEAALVLSVLRRCGIPRAEYIIVTAGQWQSIRAFEVARGLWRLSSFQAQRLEKDGNLTGALAINRQSMHMLHQLAQEKQGAEMEQLLLLYLRTYVPEYLQKLVEKHTSLVSSEEAARIKRDAEAAKDDANTYTEAARQWAAQHEPPNKLSLFIMGILTGAAVSTIPLLLLAGVIACIADRCLRESGEPDAARLGVLRHGIAWLVAYLLTFILFGMAPADIIPATVQNWLLSGSIALMLALAACWICWKVAVRRKLQFSIRFLFIVTAVWAIFLGILKTCDILPCSFSDFHVPALSVPSRGANGIDAQLLQQPFIAQYGRWIWAVYQWMVYRGPITSIGIALAVVAVWHQIRLRRIHSPTLISSRDRWARRFACLGRSSLIVAALWMLSYLWLVPTVVRFGETDYQIKIAYIENPAEYRNALAKIMVEVRAEQSWRKEVNPGKPPREHAK